MQKNRRIVLASFLLLFLGLGESLLPTEGAPHPLLLRAGLVPHTHILQGDWTGWVQPVLFFPLLKFILFFFHK